jgi:hypothetical protein
MEVGPKTWFLGQLWQVFLGAIAPTMCSLKNLQNKFPLATWLGLPSLFFPKKVT